jgi:hypothetical protein
VEGFVKGSTSAFYFDAAKNITVKNCSSRWGNNKPSYFSHVMESRNVIQLKVNNLEGQPAFLKKSKIVNHQLSH